MASKYSRTVERIMTPDEARQKCFELHLPETVSAHLVKEFERLNNPVEHDKRCGCGCPAEECERIQGGDGKVAWDESWEEAYADLARAFGLTEDQVEEVLADPFTHPSVESVWDAFFCE